jgi:OPA family glycerol-3-phosphate transporter-like MFS transporter 1/2
VKWLYQNSYFAHCLILLFHALAASGRLVVEDVGHTVDPNVTLKDTANGLPQNDLEEGHQDNQKEEDWLLDVKEAEKKQAAPLSSEMEPAIGFFEAWRIPGVATFAFCLFFSKLVAYTFLYWLPFYIRHTRIAGEFLDDKMAGNLSTLFDVGGVVGGIVAGYVSDHLKARAITAASFMLSAIPALYFYRLYGGISLPVNIGLMMLAGVLINGPYALITTAVSADLGTHKSIRANGKALATVTAIIDGTGSVGAAIGPLLTGYISSQGWDAVFKMLMVAAFCAGILLTKLVIAEFAEKFRKKPIMPCVEGEVKGNPNGKYFSLFL